jgi:hypothetical protein
MKFLPVTTKNIVIFLTSSAIVGAIGLWSSSMTMDRTIGKATANGKPIFVEGKPVVITVDRPNKNKLMLLYVAAILVGAVALATTAVDGNGDRILCPETLPDDILDTSKVLGNNLNVAALFLTGKGLKWAFGKSSIPRQILLSALPVKNRDFLKESISQKDWFKDYLAERRHYILVGSTGDGKTMVLNAIVIAFLENAEESARACGFMKDQLAICDRNFGKRDTKTGKSNTWLDLPKEHISQSVAEIMATVRSVKAELDERVADDSAYATALANRDQATADRLQAKADKRGNILLIIEEYMNTRASIKAVSPDLLKEFDAAIGEILRHGRGYLVKVLIVLQYLNGGKGADANGINLGERDQCSIVLFKSKAVQKDQVAAISSEPDVLVAKFLEALKRWQYLAIVQSGNGPPQVRLIPDLSYTSDVSVRRLENPLDAWWAEVWTKDNQEWVTDLIRKERSPKSSAFDAEIRKRFGIGRNEKDPRYQRYKQAIAQIESKQKEKELVGV